MIRLSNLLACESQSSCPARCRPSTTTDISNTSISTENVTTTFNTSTNIEDNETNEVNSLAYTGIENNSVLVVVILVGAIVAGYSLKKVKEYNI